MAHTRKKRPGLTLEQALPALRRGKSIRRRAWHPESRIVRVESEVFVRLPRFISCSGRHQIPQQWQPYPNDFFTADWEVVR